MKPLLRKDGWTAEMDRTIITQREARTPWTEIAAQVSRTVEACCARYRAILPEEKRTRHVSRRQWTLEEEAKLKQLVAEGRKPAAIAGIMGKNRHVVYSKMQQMGRTGRIVHVEMDPRVHVPEERIADRERRRSEVRDITAEFFGDPPRSQSALFQKQREHA